jgi:proteasome lid subunit RPN8/RPN11
MKLSPDAHSAFVADVLKRYPQEACGFLVDGAYVPVANTSDTPLETFRIDPVDQARVRSMGEVQALLHSHPYSLNSRLRWPAQWPSTSDMEAWMAGTIPWGICATDGEGTTRLVWLDDAERAPLVGREFVHGIHDCYAVVRDWFFINRGIALINVARGIDWWSKGQNLYEENFERAGFVEVPLEAAQVGDVVLMQYRAKVINHAAVISGPNQILHHLFHQLSGYDQLNRWVAHIKKTVRYVGTDEC